MHRLFFQNVGPDGDNRLQRQVREFAQTLYDGFLQTITENNERYSDYINNQALQINTRDEQLQQLDQQLYRDIVDIVSQVLTRILDQIENNNVN